MLLRRTLNHANQRLGEAGRLISNAQDLVTLGKLIAKDLKDGFLVTFVLLPGFAAFSKTFFKSILSYGAAVVVYRLKSLMPIGTSGEAPELDLTWMEGQKIPIGVCVDLEYDALPPAGESITFVGGTYDGKVYGGGLGDEFDEDGKNYGQTIVTMEGGEKYSWDGYVMQLYEPETVA